LGNEMATASVMKYRYKSPLEKRRLDLFARSIKKSQIKSIKNGKVAALSPYMLTYIESIQRDDPVLDEIAKVFPEAVKKHRASPVVPSLCELIRSGTVTEEDVRARTSEDLYDMLQNDWGFKWRLYGCKPEVLEILLLHPDIRRFVDCSDFLNGMISSSNEELISYLQHHSARLNINMPVHERTLAAYIASDMPTHSMTTSNTHIMLAMLRNLPFTVEELESIWQKCLENINLEVVDAIDNILGARRESDI